MVFIKPPPNAQVWHKAILRWVWVQDHNPDMPVICKSTLGLIGILFKRVQLAQGNKPSPSKEG